MSSVKDGYVKWMQLQFLKVYMSSGRYVYNSVRIYMQECLSFIQMDSLHVKASEIYKRFISALFLLLCYKTLISLSFCLSLSQSNPTIPFPFLSLFVCLFIFSSIKLHLHDCRGTVLWKYSLREVKYF